MTYIQPNKNSIIVNIILTLSGVTFAFGALWLVVLYNSVLNLNHGLAEMKTEYQALEAQSAELKESFFNLASPEKFKALASERQLIQDKKPEYLEIGTKWSYASQL
jgi:cell division protein FtsB